MSWVEIDVSRSAVDRAEVYATIVVPEVWRFDDEVLRIDWLGPGGSYAVVPGSGFLAVRAEEVTRWMRESSSVDVNAWTRWVRAEVAPR